MESPSLKEFKDMQMWHSGTQLSGGLGNVRFTIGLGDLKGLSQPK